ncbi:hypothetical protein F5Y13DRAFT_88723 [Hypoxylon sp. FL1857]|nr:hypothetical protein F5Y13DRAFT_88723 [Hypoxylon sp. FL1857]
MKNFMQLQDLRIGNGLSFVSLRWIWFPLTFLFHAKQGRHRCKELSSDGDAIQKRATSTLICVPPPLPCYAMLFGLARRR